MASQIAQWIDNQIYDGVAPSDAATELIFAAFEGENELAQTVIEKVADYSTPNTRVEAAGKSGQPIAVNDGGVFLSRIAVEGFRGIGSVAELNLEPKPGLTVISGRNGSGKSSFSDALELVLTGSTYRWSKKSAVEWSKHWRNLHHSPTQINIDLVQEGTGSIEIEATWDPSEELASAQKLIMQRSNANGKGKQEPGIEQLGWQTALERYNPILSYDELGGMLQSRPSDLYDAISDILGVQQFNDVKKWLDAQSKQLGQAQKEVSSLKKELKESLDAIDQASGDERAQAALALIRKREPDTAALRNLATGSTTDTPDNVRNLKLLSELPLPIQEQVDVALTDLAEAKNGLANAALVSSGQKKDRLNMLSAAIAYHKTHGDGPCPVCEGRVLDDTWQAEVEAELAGEQQFIEQLEAATNAFGAAFRAVTQFVTPAPAILSEDVDPTVKAEQDAVLEAWNAWSQGGFAQNPTGADQLIAHVKSALPLLTEWADELKAKSNATLQALDGAWQPVAGRILDFAKAAEEAAKNSAVLADLTEAKTWVASKDTEYRNSFLQEIEQKAVEAWERLRQESNVAIDSLILESTSLNNRKLVIKGKIDEEEISTLSILSQGELHALALALFLPRATQPDSPFRFVVLDDPVQAMDPSKIDGLIDVFRDLVDNQRRQVIVFSHDDRLADALRRSAISAQIKEVDRGVDSQVTVTTSLDPVKRYLDDAKDLRTTYGMGSLRFGDAATAISGLYRIAIEQAARTRYLTTRLAAGEKLVDLEAKWKKAYKTSQKIHLALFPDVPIDKKAVMDKWLSHGTRANALGVANEGIHGNGNIGKIDKAKGWVESLIDDIQRGLKNE